MADQELIKKPPSNKKPSSNKKPPSNKEPQKRKKISLKPTTIDSENNFKRYIDEFFSKTFIDEVLPTGIN